MKQRVKKYTFNPAARTVTFTDFPGQIHLNQTLLIANVSTGTIIYNAISPLKGGTVLGNVLTLEYDTTAMSATDELLIEYEISADDPYQDRPSQVEVTNLVGNDLTIDMQLDGNPARSDSPGVQAVSLIGPTGDPIDTVNGGLLHTQTNAPDLSRGDFGQTAAIVTSQRKEVIVNLPLLGTGQNQPYAGHQWDVGNYKSMTFHYLSGPASLNLFQSNNGVTWSALPVTQITTLNGLVTSGNGIMQPPNIYAADCRTRYVALMASSINAPGPVSGVIEFYTDPFPIQVANETGSITWSGADGQPGGTLWGKVVASAAMIWNGATSDRARSVQAVVNSPTATGITASGVVGQVDEFASQTVSEDRFGAVRMTPRRALHNVLRDGSGRGGSPTWPSAITALQTFLATPDFGVEVSMRSRLMVDAESDMMGSDPIVQVQPGLQGVAIVGQLGDPIDVSRGGLRVTPTDITPERAPFSAVSSSSMAVTSSGTRVFSLWASNANAAVRYLQVFSKTTAPAASEVPALSIPIPAGTPTQPSAVELGTEFFGPNGLALNGLAVGISTTGSSFTAATPADHTINGTTT